MPGTLLSHPSADGADSRFPLPGCFREKRGVGSRRQVFRSSAGITGSMHRSGGLQAQRDDALSDGGRKAKMPFGPEAKHTFGCPPEPAPRNMNDIFFEMSHAEIID